MALDEKQKLDLFPHPKQLQSQAKYMKIVLNTVDIRQWKAVIPERQDMNELSPKIAPAFCTERISSTQHKKGEPRWSLVVSLKRGNREGWGG